MYQRERRTQSSNFAHRPPPQPSSLDVVYIHKMSAFREHALYRIIMPRAVLACPSRPPPPRGRRCHSTPNPNPVTTPGTVTTPTITPLTAPQIREAAITLTRASSSSSSLLLPPSDIANFLDRLHLTPGGRIFLATSPPEETTTDDIQPSPKMKAKTTPRIRGLVTLACTEEARAVCPLPHAKRLPVPTDSAYLANLAVLVTHRRQGLATALLATALEAARDGGAASMALHVEVDNIPATNLYQEAGFVEVDRDGLFTRPRLALMVRAF